MKKLLVTATLLLSFNGFAVDLPLKCVDEFSDGGVGKKMIAKDKKETFDFFHKMSAKEWAKLQTLVTSESFKQRGVRSDIYIKWAKGNDSLKRVLNLSIKPKDVKNTDYYECLTVLNNSIAFQPDFASSTDSDITKVGYYRSQVERQFKLLENR